MEETDYSSWCRLQCAGMRRHRVLGGHGVRAPPRWRALHGDGALYAVASTTHPLCVRWAAVADDESDLAAMSLRLWRAGDDDEEVAEWDSVTVTPTQTGEWCASGAASAALEQGAVYFTALTVTNGAGLSATAESAAVLIVHTADGGRGDGERRVPERLRRPGRLPGLGGGRAAACASTASTTTRAASARGAPPSRRTTAITSPPPATAAR